eukprot:scaffold302331_cov19-Tisochrysis_lutea.AAC.1
MQVNMSEHLHNHTACAHVNARACKEGAGARHEQNEPSTQVTTITGRACYARQQCLPATCNVSAAAGSTTEASPVSPGPDNGVILEPSSVMRLYSFMHTREHETVHKGCMQLKCIRPKGSAEGRHAS